jgi:hypothetical protein
MAQEQIELNDGFGAFSWMDGQGRHEPIAGHRSGRSSRSAASLAVELQVPRVKRPFMHWTVNDSDQPKAVLNRKHDSLHTVSVGALIASKWFS